MPSPGRRPSPPNKPSLPLQVADLAREARREQRKVPGLRTRAVGAGDATATGILSVESDLVAVGWDSEDPGPIRMDLPGDGGLWMISFDAYVMFAPASPVGPDDGTTYRVDMVGGLYPVGPVAPSPAQGSYSHEWLYPPGAGSIFFRHSITTWGITAPGNGIQAMARSLYVATDGPIQGQLSAVLLAPL